MIFFKKSIDKIIAEKGREICEKTHAQAIGRGHKITQGKDTGKDAIVIFVKKKLPENQLSPEEKVPKKIDGRVTDVIETGGEILPMGHRQKMRPIIGGTSGKVIGGTACTIGLIVFKDGKPHALTNEHCVMFPSGRNNVGKKFLNPSPADGGTPADAIGTIIYPPRIKNTEVNKIDSHIIPLDVDYRLAVQGLESYQRKWVKPKVGMSFVKLSRTTAKTTGRISHINALAKVNFGGSLGVCEFYPCIFALQNNFNIVAGGDSGSCIFNSEGVIGQTFAAAPNLAVFLVGEVVGRELGIELDKPIEGYIALGRWLSFDRLEITTKSNTRLRKDPGLRGTSIRILTRGTRVKIVGGGGIKDNYFWLKVRI